MSLPAYGTPGGPQRPPDPAAGEWSVEERLRRQAVRNLRRRAAFRVHLLVYALVSVLQVAVWLTVGIATGVWFPWWVFPVLGWGVGVAVHGWTAYRGDELSEERIRAEMRRIAGG
jgi:2TM domain